MTLYKLAVSSVIVWALDTLLFIVISEPRKVELFSNVIRQSFAISTTLLAISPSRKSAFQQEGSVKFFYF